MVLKGKQVVLGVCGSIAAYKAALLTRLLVQEGAHVQVIMTKEATHFITPLTLSTLSKNPVLVDYYTPETGEWNNHVHLGLHADILLVAPASANTLAKFANGICDNLLTAVYLSAKCPVYIAPAMDLDMWKHPSTKNNVGLLQSYGNTIIPPGKGELASGLSGEGRLAEPEAILAFLTRQKAPASPLSGKKALVTAGPTYEPIDPVRFIGNHSSGKMGYAIAEVLASLGVEVTLVSGPSGLTSSPAIARINVQSAAEMLVACENHFEHADIIVMSAAVADYTPTHVAEKKIKKQEDMLQLTLKKTTDILKKLGERKRPDQTLVGFALETDNEEANARQKLKNKNLDLIVLNSMRDPGAGFGTETNKVTIFARDGSRTDIDLRPKTEVARAICEQVIRYREQP